MGDINIIDYGISNASLENKREFLYRLDLKLKNIHEQGGYLFEVNPKKISIDPASGEPYFDEIYTYSPNSYQDFEQMKKLNLVWMADLAVCLYFPEYNLENGLLNLQVLSDNFDTIKTFIPSEDVKYYSDIILNASVNSTLPFSYFSDYINKKAATGNTHSNMIQYTKSTPIGRAMANSDNEAGMINYVFITCLVFALVMLTVLFAFYLA